MSAMFYLLIQKWMYIELDPLFASWVADVPRNNIRRGEYNGNQKGKNR